MIQVTLHTGIHIPNWSDVKAQYPSLAKRLSTDLKLTNPAYLQARRVGRKGYGIPRQIHCYEWDKEQNVLTLPIGYLPRLLSHAEGRVELTDRRTLRLAPPVKSEIELRGYQEPAVEAMVNTLNARGVALLIAPAGSGKTEMSLEIVARLGQSTLWITHTRELAEQAAQRAIDRLGLEPADIGYLIGGRKKRAGKILTIGVIQSLVRMDLGPWAERFGTVALDECHHTPATTWSKVLGSLAPRYRFGVTASLERQDTLEEITRLYFGPPAHEIERRHGGTLTPVLRKVTTECKPKAWIEFQKVDEAYKKVMAAYEAGTIKRQPQKPQMPYGAILDELLNDEERNQLIVDLLEQKSPGHHALVLSARVEHCELLADMLAARVPDRKDRIAVIHGGQSKTLRREILKAARAGKLDVLFSVDIAKEGLDVPILDQLYLVGGGKDRIYILQAVGRIQRPHPGKKGCVVFDFVDEEVGVMQAQHWQRMRIYRELGMVRPRGQHRAQVQMAGVGA